MTITIPLDGRLYEITADYLRVSSEDYDLDICPTAYVSSEFSGYRRETSYSEFLRRYSEAHDVSIERVMSLVHDWFLARYEDDRRNGLADYA